MRKLPKWPGRATPRAHRQPRPPALRSLPSPAGPTQAEPCPAAPCLACLDLPRTYRAELCLRTGYLSLRHLADIFDIDERRYDTAIAALRELPELRSAAPLWNTYIVSLASSGHRDEAMLEGVEFMARFPSCGSRALVLDVEPQNLGGGRRRGT